MKKRFPLVMLALLFSSCATHLGMISSGVPEHPIQYVDIAIGAAQTDYVFGIGGLSKDALVLQAKQNMMKSRPLKKNEMYMNFTVDFKRSFWLVYLQTKVTVSADVVQGTGDRDLSPFSPGYRDRLGSAASPDKLFAVGDTVIFDKTHRGTIVSIGRKGSLHVSYQTDNGDFRVTNMARNSVFSPDKSYRGFRAGDLYANTYAHGGKVETVTGKIVGVGTQFVLLKTLDGGIIRIWYK
jgi:hypothetical protein